MLASGTGMLKGGVNARRGFGTVDTSSPWELC
jgi:hypothetical protein